ncbi:MAG: hypothetical protein A2Z43_00950 [Syntrophobacterales bacterium RBG_19FT_COMBO_59_10]|nr:MAG: hypothetical protein A2Z43_00950 [Syntrophobacterales bacterium RBG_19FT_COMBO_59_10]
MLFADRDFGGKLNTPGGDVKTGAPAIACPGFMDFRACPGHLKEQTISLSLAYPRQAAGNGLADGFNGRLKGRTGESKMD